MSSNQRSMSQALHISLIALLFYVFPACAKVYRWGDALYHINFGGKEIGPFSLYSPKDFSEPPFRWTSFLPELGAYGGHVWKPGKLEYSLNVSGSGFDLVDVKLGFAEVYLNACTNDGRIMRMSVNDQQIASVNIFELVGCRKPHDIVFEQVDASSPIKIVIEGIVENPMISNLVVRQAAVATSSPTSLPSGLRKEASISRSFGAFNKALFINPSIVNRFSGISRTGVFKDRDALIEGTIRPDILLGHRHGRNFTYHVKGQGTYEIQLSFAETNPVYCDGSSDRVFSVFLNGVLELKNLNVFKEQGCRRAYIHTRSEFEIRGNLFITFTGISGNAMISHIIVRMVQTSCIPESTADAATSDHLAHSVPGQYPPIRSANSPRAYVDSDNNGYEEIVINGEGSHTHFFDTENNIAGRVTSYEWTSADTTEFISEKMSFTMKFRPGTTRLSLKVRDNICSSHTAETSVTVTGSVTSGTYCYFYPGQTTMPIAGGPDQEIKPSFSKAYPNTKWNFTDLPFASSDFAARCQFFVLVNSAASKLSGIITTEGTARVSLLRGMDAVVDDETSSTPFSVPLVASMSSFEILYLHSKSQKPPILNLEISAALDPSYSYDRSTVFPVITSLAPTSSSLGGANTASVQVLGASLSATDIHIGNKTVSVSRRDTDTRKLFFKIPPSDKAGKTDISVEWEGGFISNSLTFTYFNGDASDPVAFTENVLTSESSGQPAKSELASCIRIGYDGNIYLGTLNARVLKLTYDPNSLQVTHKCQSEPLEDARFTWNETIAPRAILGMALDPSDAVPRPYVSTQTLFWLVRERIDPLNPAAWRNGAIDRLKPGNVANDESICLVFDKEIISGLPVSNHDHGVNGLEFTQTGDLLISIGGNTNAGLPGKGLGERFETPLSGAIILAKLSKGPAFDGKIQYSNDTDPHKGSVLSGDIELIATGLRNAFFPSLHSSGRLYIADNGPNAAFGNVASMCSEINDNVTYPKEEPSDFPGKVKLGPSFAPYGVSRPDKVLNIKLGGKPRYYGHPNPNRGECFYVDPLTNKGPSNETAPANYEPPLLLVSSSTNAIVEYHAGNVFNGALKDKLIFSTYKNRPTFYIPPITEPEEASPELISAKGGLSLAVNAWGQMIVPRLQENNILVLKPKVPNLEEREIVSITAVTPFRHTKLGDTVATIGGYNFGPGVASVKIGGRPCVLLTQSLTTITCRTPPALRPGKRENIGVTIEDGGSAVLPNGIWYTEV